MSRIDTLKKDSSISVAIITHDFSGFSGSQLVALEIANHHASLGHHVAIRAERNSDFLLPYLHENCSIAKERIDISEYDIVWSMHGHFCLNTKDLNRLKKWKGKFISIHLSASTPAETYHHYFSARFSNARVFNCQRAMDILEHSQSVVGKSYNMKNAAPRKFHNFAPSNTVKLQKLLVVSNHLPQEVEDALKILVEQNVDVIHVGIAGSYKLIQPQDILDADAVLTIGKTAQYALCGTHPVYCYDHFGGPGWINDDNFPIANERNFSGRCSPLKKTPNQIVNELVLGFEEAKKFVEKNWSTFSTSYNLEGFLDHVLSEVDGNLFDSDECLNLIDLMRGSMIHVNWIWGDVFSNPELIERDRQISILTQAVTEPDGQIAKLNHAVAERDERIDCLQRVLSDKDDSINQLSNSLAAIYKSRSWKITRPLRFITRLYLNRKQNMIRHLCEVKIFAKSLRQHGLLTAVNKILYKLKRLSFSNRHSLALRLSAINRTCSIDTTKDGRPINRTLISMIKNEKSVIETFAAHALAMFDRVIFVDHQSTDGTGEYLKSLANTYPKVEYFLFDEPGYYQSEVMTWVVKNIVGPTYDGWVFFLDADEYLDFKTRNEFDNKLANYASFPLISMPWLNLVPLDTETGKINGGLFLKPIKTAIHCKIAFQPRLMPVDDYVVAQGNHALLIGEGNLQTFPAQEAFAILHIPIRTKQQLTDKIKAGVESYEKMGKNRGENEGFHWYEINRLIETNGLTDSLMADMVARYGQQLTPPYGKSLKTMVNEGYTELNLEICMADHIESFYEITPENIMDISTLKALVKEEKQVLKRSLKIELDMETRDPLINHANDRD